MGTPFDANNPFSDGWTPKRAGIEPPLVFQDDSATYAARADVSTVSVGGAGGATLDGVTDDTAAIQARVTASATLGCGVHIPAGKTALISAPIVLPAGFAGFFGPGKLMPTSGFTAGSTINCVLVINGNDVRVEGIMIDGTGGPSATSGIGIAGTYSRIRITGCRVSNTRHGVMSQTQAVTDVTVERCHVESTSVHGITFAAGATRLKILNNTLLNAGAAGVGHAIQVWYPSGIGNYDIEIIGNQITNPGWIPIEIQQGERGVVANNNIYGGYNGISVGSCSYLVVIGNNVRDQQRYGAEMGSGSHQTVAGNTFYNCNIGIVTNGVTNHLTITGNTIDTTTGGLASGTANADAIRIYGVNTCTVTGNTIIDPSGFGVVVANDTASGSNLAPKNINITANTFKFAATRAANAPTAVRLANAINASVTDNVIEVGADYSAANFFGIITVGAATDATVADNQIVATTASPAANPGILLNSGTTPTGIIIRGNKLKNFASGIDTNQASGGYSASAYLNEFSGCTTNETHGASTSTIAPGVGISTTQLSSGEAVLPRFLGARDNTSAVGSGQLLLTYFRAEKTETIARIRVATGNTAAAATPTLVRLGIWSVTLSTGALTALLASTTTDTTLLAAANTLYTPPLSSSFSKQAGIWYAVGVLVVSGAAIPTFQGIQELNATTAGGGDIPRLYGLAASQSDLPSTLTSGSISNTTRAVQFLLLP